MHISEVVVLVSLFKFFLNVYFTTLVHKYVFMYVGMHLHPKKK